jgi:hypothetical protein
MFTNAGYSIADVAAEYNIPEAELLNSANWTGNQFSFGTIALTFNFTYQGDIFV